jgi:hypothetical protein
MTTTQQEASDLAPNPQRKRGRPRKTQQPGDSSLQGDIGAGSTPQTSRLLAASRRSRDYKQAGDVLTRQLDIPLRVTPIPEVPFRAWPDAGDEHPVAILRVRNDSDRKEAYILSPEIADLPYVAPKVRDASLVPCVTETGKLYVWARTDPDPNDRLSFRIFNNLLRVCEEARKKWIAITWSNGVLSLQYPRKPIEEEPRWPSGQTLEEIYELAIHEAYIDSPDHPAIRGLDVIRREMAQ